MDSEAYWKQRAEEREKYWHTICQETIEAQLADYYQASLGRIQTDIAALYGRFAVDNELSIAEAYKLLTGKEFRQWRMSMEAYLKQIQDSGDKGLERELNTLAMRSRISRLDKLYSETLQELDWLGRKTSKDMTDFLTEAYKDNYYRGTYDIAKAGELKNAVSKVDSKALEDVLRTRWSGKNYSERIWKNQKLLAKTIKDEMMTAVHRGESVHKISERIARRMNVGISNARRLVRTEMNYVHNQAALDSIHDAGMKYFRFIATLDRRTSAICRAHDGHVYPVSEAASGTNVPPLHPNCRSTIAGSLYGPGKAKTGTRAARNQQTGKTVYVPANMQYEDWKAVYVDKTKTLAEWQKEFNKTDKKDSGAVAAETKRPKTFVEKVIRKVKEVFGHESTPEVFIPYEKREYPFLTSKDFTKLSQSHNKKLPSDIKKQIAKHAQDGSLSGGYVATRNYQVINGYLRGDSYYAKIITKDDLKTIDAMRQVISSHTLGRDCTLTRYVNGDYLTEVWGIENPRDGGVITNYFPIADNLQKYIPQITKSIQQHIGEVVSDKAFLSTSGVRDKNIMKDKPVLFEILAPKETPCYITKNRKESECILADNIPIRIEDVEYSELAHKWIIKGRVVLEE